MNKTLNLPLTRLISWDIMILVIIYFVPTLSHMLSFPLFVIDPMRISILGSYLFLRNRNNAYVMAMTLPLFSYLVAGHPIAIKNVIIAIELLTNIFILDLLIKRTNKIFIVTFTSILFSKVLYYILKGLVISFGLLNSTLVDTSSWTQLIVGIAISVMFSIVYSKRNFAQ